MEGILPRQFHARHGEEGKLHPSASRSRSSAGAKDLVGLGMVFRDQGRRFREVGQRGGRPGGRGGVSEPASSSSISSMAPACAK